MQVITDISKDGKKIYESNVRRTFYGTPKPPYDLGDKWVVGSTAPEKVCILKRLTGDYEDSDWDLASNATDDSGLVNFIDDTYTPKVALIDTNVATAQTTANTGVTNAATAQTTANTVKAYTDNLASDSVITPDEKLTLKPEWDLIVLEATATTGTISAQAIQFGVSHTAFDTAYSDLNTYLNTTLTLFTNMTTATTGINRTNWNNYWNTYYDERTKILNAIQSKPSIIEDTFECSNIPKNNLINDHSFELLRIDGTTLKIPQAGNPLQPAWGWYEGDPKLRSNLNTGIPSSAMFGNQYIDTKLANSVAEYMILEPEEEFCFSSYIKRFTEGAGTPRVTIKQIQVDGEYNETELSSTSYSLSISDGWFKRAYCTFTTPAWAEGYYVYQIIILDSTDTNYISWDGTQLIYGNIPCIYNPESQLWSFANEQLAIKPAFQSEQGTFIRLGRNATQSITLNTYTQVVWQLENANTSTKLTKTGNTVVIGAGVSFITVSSQLQFSAATRRTSNLYSKKWSSI